MPLDALLAALDLAPGEAFALAGIALLAGTVRGFSGFALSAIVMAGSVAILPPAELIPVCWWLEMTASLLMLRGGVREADRRIVGGLVAGSLLGVPVGLALTTQLPAEGSKTIALALILALAMLQLARVRLAFLATLPGLAVSGLTAGIATGLASVGGMVVALYVLAQDAAPARMRGSLVAFLFISSLSTCLFLILYGLMTREAVARGLALAGPTAIGVFAGQRLFSPRWAPVYKPVCLTLLCLLAASGLLRLALGGWTS